MAIIKLHGFPMSSCTMRVMLCLYEKGLEFQFLPIDVAAAAHKQQPYLSLNPFGLMPALEDGDLILFESRTITRYLARKHKDTGTDLLRLGDLTESRIVDTWLEVEAQQYNGPTNEIKRQMVINPVLRKAPDEEIINKEIEKLEKVLDVYEERLTKWRNLGGNHYTLADLHHIPYLVHFMKTPKATVVTSRPHVNAWWNDISSRPASIKVSENLKF